MPNRLSSAPALTHFVLLTRLAVLSHLARPVLELLPLALKLLEFRATRLNLGPIGGHLAHEELGIQVHLREHNRVLMMALGVGGGLGEQGADGVRAAVELEQRVGGACGRLVDLVDWLGLRARVDPDLLGTSAGPSEMLTLIISRRRLRRSTVVLMPRSCSVMSVNACGQSRVRVLLTSERSASCRSTPSSVAFASVVAFSAFSVERLLLEYALGRLCSREGRIGGMAG